MKTNMRNRSNTLIGLVLTIGMASSSAWAKTPGLVFDPDSIGVDDNPFERKLKLTPGYLDDDDYLTLARKLAAARITLKSESDETSDNTVAVEYIPTLSLSVLGKVVERCASKPMNADQLKNRNLWLYKHHIGLVNLILCMKITSKHSAQQLQACAADRVSGLAGMNNQAKMDKFMYFMCFRPNANGDYEPELPGCTMSPLIGRLEMVNGLQTIPEVFDAPLDKNAPYQVIPQGFSYITDCQEGCYKPGQHILFDDGEEAIEKALSELKETIMVVDENSTMSSISLEKAPVKNFMRSIQPGWEYIITIVTVSGGRLEVTANHPLLDDQGILREASSFQIGDSLVRVSGELDPIVQIQTDRWFGTVYNVRPESVDPLNHLIVAEGFLNGSSYFQNEGKVDRMRLTIRNSVPDSIIE